VSTLLPALFVVGTGDWVKVILVILLGVVVHVFEANFVVPRIMQRKVYLPPVLTIAGVLIMGTLLGAVGLVVAVPILCVTMVLIRHILHGQIYGDIARLTQSSALLKKRADGGGKLKTPLELLTSSLRALEAKPDGSLKLSRVLGALGQPILLQPVPTGYAESADAWTSSGALLARMNMASALGSGRLPGVGLDLDRVLPAPTDPEQLVRAVDARLLGGRGSAQTLAVIRREISSEQAPETRRAIAIALALGSPDFQRQ